LKNKTAVIIGVTGQDGSLLSSLLLKKRYKVIGTTTSNKTKSLKKLNILNKIDLIFKKKYNQIFFRNLLNRKHVKEVYFFSGQSSVSKSEKLNHTTLDSNLDPLIDLLEVLRKNKKKIKLINAVSSEMFGNSKKKINEMSKLNPESFYGLAKCISFEISKSYRSQFGINICNLILFNHESNLRPPNFVIRKLVSEVKKIKQNKNFKKKIIVGNINIKRDWGYAKEYVAFMNKVAKSKFCDDYIVATGKTYKLKDVINKLFEHNKLNIKNNLEISPKYFRKNEIVQNYADISKIKKTFKWQPKQNILKFITDL
tara:strand:- start:3727 stop:4662 length:936 start_codon:yes stop_codon:yes gene_type:complete